MQVQFTQGDPEWHQWRERCQTDLYWFAGVVLGYGDILRMTPGVHGLLCKFTARSLGIPEIDSAPIRKIEVPRGAGKTTLVTQAWVIQLLLQDPNRSILICNEKLENAAAFLSAIKKEFENNETLRLLFPEIVPDPKQTVWATDKITVQRSSNRKEPSIFCIGTGGTVTGMHPDHIVGDDILSREAAENARAGNADITGRINRWITQLRPLLNPFAEPFPDITFPCTRWYMGDSYEFIEEAFGYGEQKRIWNITQRLPDGTSITVPIYRVGDVAVFRRAAIENGKTIWPENPMFTMEALAKTRMADPVLFAANYQNNPSDELTATLKESWLRFYDRPDGRLVTFNRQDGPDKPVELQNLDRVMLVDPGGFGSVRGQDRMRAAIVVTGTDLKTYDHAILEAWSESETFQRVIEEIIALASRYSPRKIAIEQAGQQAAFIELVRRTMRERLVQWPIEVVTPKATLKEQRILALEPYFQRGQIYVGKGPNMTEFREQYRQFPRGRRVDLLDALAYGPQIWRRPAGLAGQSTQQRQDRERMQYLAKRGMAPWRVS